MFIFAFLIGIYLYIIFSLGILGLLYKSYIVLLSAAYVSISIYFIATNFRGKLLQYFNVLKKRSQVTKRGVFINSLIILLILQAAVNLIGTLGPELGFDALWYHLTLPKLYLMNHSIEYIPGGLLYYSVMPKLTEMLYITALSLGNEITAKLIHFSFGILSLIVLYKISRKFFKNTYSWLVVVLFYSNLVVGWMSITAYIDLSRTFFETMALWGFLNWIETKKMKWLITSAVLLGLAISTKLLAIGSLLIFIILIIFISLKRKEKLKNLIIKLFVYSFICLLIPLPWFIFSFINTGNPIYPFFSDIYPVKLNFSLINPLSLSDPISPLYIILVPIGFVFFNKLESRLKLVALYSFLAFLIWQLTPNTGGGRFILPYLPAISVFSVGIIAMMRKRLQLVFTVIIIFFSLFSILYRGAANLKYIPVIFGHESKAQFLSRNLNFSFGDFYDTDGYFAKTIKKEDKVLLYGFHNLYYVDFPFVDATFARKNEKFNYIATQNASLPEKFNSWKLIYSNPTTFVKLYIND